MGAKTAQHVLLANPADGRVAEGREGVFLQTPHPITCVLSVAPARLVSLERPFSGFAEGRCPAPAFFGEQVAARARQFAVLERLLPGLSQTHELPPAQADVSAASADSEPLYPAFRPVGSHVQVEGSAVVMQARFRERFYPRGGELPHCFPTLFPHVWSGNFQNRTAFASLLETDNYLYDALLRGYGAPWEHPGNR